MATSRILNPEDRMQSIYLENLQKTIESLCKIVNILVSQDQIIFDAYENIKQVIGEIKYFQKFNNKSNPISKFISKTITIIQSHSEHFPSNQIIKQNGLPPVKVSKDSNLKSLHTIAQKQSQENLLQNYIRNESKRKNNNNNNNKNLKINQGYSRTINQPVSYLNTSRQFQIIREQTRRSLDNPGINNKKPLYKELQKFKGTEHIFPAVKDYLQKRNSKNIKTNKMHNYTISKFL